MVKKKINETIKLKKCHTVFNKAACIHKVEVLENIENRVTQGAYFPQLPTASLIQENPFFLDFKKKSNEVLCKA